MNDAIKKLQEQITLEQRKISNCKHQWAKTFYNPYIVNEPYGYKTVGQGSDHWTEPEGYREAKKPRWTRVCTVCGYEQHTEDQEPIITGFKPKF